MSADSAVTYTSVHSEARSWSIPSEDPYEEAARQLLEQAPRSPEYAPEDHVPVYIPEPEHPEDFVPAEDEAPAPLLPPFFLSPRIRPPHTRAAMRQMRAAAPSTYHSLLPSGTPPLLPIPLPSTSRRADIPEADTPPRKRLLLTTPRPECEVGESSAAAATRQPGPTIETRLRDTERRMMTALELAVRAEIEVLRRERLAYEQESMETHQALARSEAHCRALEIRVTVLETEVRRHEWQRQATDDLAVQHIMRTHALEAGARIDTLEDTSSSSFDFVIFVSTMHLLSITGKWHQGGRPTRGQLGTTPPPVTDTHTTTSVTSAQLQAMIDEGVTAVLAARATTRNGDDSHTSGTGVRRNERAVRECTYQDFMKCQPLFFRGTEASGSTDPMTVTNDIAYAMTWTDLKKKMTTKYCPRNEIKKVEAELWNLKVKGTDVVAYNQRFQELALLCDRMFPEETDKIERYVGGMPDLIYSSVVASKPKTIQEAIEMVTELMDRRISIVEQARAREHLKIILVLYANFPSVILEFQSTVPWSRDDNKGIHMDHSHRSKSLKIGTPKTTNGGFRSVFRSCGYYQDSMKGFQRSAKPMTSSLKEGKEREHRKSSSFSHDFSLDLHKQYLVCSDFEARKLENIKNEVVGGMLIETAKYPEALRTEKLDLSPTIEVSTPSRFRENCIKSKDKLYWLPNMKADIAPMLASA
ncbi:putative reverse transcriptase domain-containing protein [Tanacetum coccineum]|uniref:Reverse transcriptase domain-containing protein n=1 Tax=Tanacetum coccineum TaxID=301880 RepID=A0ABQ4ZPF6_9ASTR